MLAFTKQQRCLPPAGTAPSSMQAPPHHALLHRRPSPPQAAAGDASAAAAPHQQQQQQQPGSSRPQLQQQQQQQQPRQQQQRQQQRRRVREGLTPPPLSNKPFVVRVAGRTSNIQGAAGAITKRLQLDDIIRVAAIDSGSIYKAVLALTAANNMVAGNSGQMLVFHPQVVTNAAEAPKIPSGSLLFYTSQVVQGEVLAQNALLVKAGTAMEPLAGAIATRIRQQAHTVLECYGAAAVTTAVQALALARRYLRSSQQDIACLIASGRKVLPEPPAADAADAAAGAAAAADTHPEPAAAAAAAAAPVSGSKYPAMCHRLVVLECKPGQPRMLLVRASMGMTDKLQPGAAAAIAATDEAAAADAGGVS